MELGLMALLPIVLVMKRKDASPVNLITFTVAHKPEETYKQGCLLKNLSSLVDYTSATITTTACDLTLDPHMV